MQQEEYLFPYEMVPRGVSVAIYGAGAVGRSFLRQLLKTHYARIACMVDCRAEVLQIYSVPVVPLEGLGGFQYDYLVIALDNPVIAAQVKQSLMDKQFVPQEKIVMGCHRSMGNFDKIYKFQNDFLMENGLNIAFFLPGGLGDCIVAKKVIIEFLKNFSRISYQVVLYGTSENDVYLKMVFGDCKFLITNPGSARYLDAVHMYDLAIYIGYFFRMDYFSEEHFKRWAPELVPMMQILEQELRIYGLNPVRVTDNAVHFLRCRFLGRNVYEGYNYCSCLSIQDTHVVLPIPKKNRMTFGDIYITINAGWGRSDISSCKQWSIRNWENLIIEIKREFPFVKIVQLGGVAAKCLQKVDEYCLGEGLDKCKAVLYGATLHIDTEGGLVHLATQLGTKCVVLFGPTPVWYFGYKQNDNIQAGDCQACYQLEETYYCCLRRMQGPPCMEAITPELVMGYVKERIKKYVEK